MSIVPTEASGGVVIRDQGGNCLARPNVKNAYCPPPSFGSTCELRYLPNDCSARITPAQMNGFQSELLCLARELNPGGNWNCGGLCNLSTTFANWRDSTARREGNYLDALQKHLCARPFATDMDNLADPGYILCDGDGNVVQLNPAEQAEDAVDEICGSALLCRQLAGCLISEDDGNDLALSTGDGLLYVASLTGPAIVQRICSNEDALTALVECLPLYPVVLDGTGTTVRTEIDIETGRTAYRVDVTQPALECLPSGLLRYTEVDGTETHIFPTQEDTEVLIPFATFDITVASPENTVVAGSSLTLSFEVTGECPRPVEFRYGTGYELEVPPSDDYSGGQYANVTLEYSLDGGTWTELVDFGGDLVLSPSTRGEQEFIRYHREVLAPGVHTFEVRHRLNLFVLRGSNQLQNTRTTLRSTIRGFACC